MDEWPNGLTRGANERCCGKSPLNSKAPFQQAVSGLDTRVVFALSFFFAIVLRYHVRRFFLAECCVSTDVKRKSVCDSLLHPWLLTGVMIGSRLL